eukprot:Nitzschia sp. Nitz4//scaffold3_size479765//288107//289697//NITZ4_000120-RA/size479765-exonerate_est2genome-gene-1.198-mRNA-1//1//CDS//3329550818//6529//frame0
MPECDVSVVLLCKGRGADPSSFRPNRDETQWWSRRDALVRCITSFLLGPTDLHPTAGTGGPGRSNRNLIICFDDDFALLFLSVEAKQSGGSILIPTEQAILGLIKRASQSIGNSVQLGGLRARMEFDPMLAKMRKPQSTNNSSTLTTISGLDSKRQVLQYLQEQCSIDFLRKHGLNSSPATILKKTNKQKLMEIWKQWKPPKQVSPLSNAGSEKGISQSPETAEVLLERLLNKAVGSSNRGHVETIVGVLHESCEEFPCFGTIDRGENAGDDSVPPRHLILFLGAVRDMTQLENQTLEQLCTKKAYPFVGIRFGTVPEFTSKILTILALHHAQGVLHPACSRLLHQAVQYPIPTTASLEAQTSLHILCRIPIAFSTLSLELANRDRVHWCLVRIVVVSLWRSKMVSQESRDVGHANSLCLLFEDGVVIYLTEREFVGHLANKHQAAPSEHQILKAIQECAATTIAGSDIGAASKDAIRQIVQKAPRSPTAAIDITQVPVPSSKNTIISN